MNLIATKVALRRPKRPLMFLFKFCLQVDGTQRAVMFNVFGGVSNKVYTQGTHFKVQLQLSQNLILLTVTGTSILDLVIFYLNFSVENVFDVFKHIINVLRFLGLWGRSVMIARCGLSWSKPQQAQKICRW